MEDKFAPADLLVLKKNVEAIKTIIARHLAERKEDKEFKFTNGPAEEGSLKLLTEAFDGLEHFYESGRKQWYLMYKHIFTKYRYQPNLKSIWDKIGAGYESIWNILTLEEKTAITQHGVRLSLPNFKNKGYGQLKTELDSDLKARIKEFDETYELTLGTQADNFQLHIAQISLPPMYLLTCTLAQIEMNLESKTLKEIKPEITAIIVKFLIEFLES